MVNFNVCVSPSCYIFTCVFSIPHHLKGPRPAIKLHPTSMDKKFNFIHRYLISSLLTIAVDKYLPVHIPTKRISGPAETIYARTWTRRRGISIPGVDQGMS